MIKHFWVQNNSVMLITPNFWDKRHGNVTYGSAVALTLQLFPPIANILWNYS